MLDCQFVGVVGKVKQMHISYVEPTVRWPSAERFHKGFLLPSAAVCGRKFKQFSSTSPCFLHPRLFLPCFGKSFTDWHSEVVVTFVLGERSFPTVTSFRLGLDASLAPAVLHLDNQIFKCVSESLPPVINAKLLPGPFSCFRSLLSAAQQCHGPGCSWAHACHFWELTRWGTQLVLGKKPVLFLAPELCPQSRHVRGIGWSVSCRSIQFGNDL